MSTDLAATETFFHVDRARTLARTGGVIALDGGVSSHGRYYRDNPAPLGSVTWNGSSDSVMSTSFAIEHFVELYRHALCPDLPSRFNSMFAFTTLGDARDFAADHGGGEVSQITVPAETVTHRGDMNWLHTGTYTYSFECARNYWEGHPSSTPRWEVLIALPVTATITALS